MDALVQRRLAARTRTTARTRPAEVGTASLRLLRVGGLKLARELKLSFSKMAPRARAEAWTDTLTSCINDVVIMRPENPLETLGHLLADSNARPNWKESAATYAKRHDIHNRLALALDQAGINPREAPPKDVLALLSAALLGETAAAAGDKKAAEKAAAKAAVKEVRR